MNLNIYTGHLGKDFELQYLANGTALAKNSLAVRRDYKDKSTGQYETDWIPLTVFGKTAEIMSNHLQKGSKVGIVGRLQTNKYTDNDGNNRVGYDVIVDSFEFLDSRKDNQQNNQQNQNQQRNQGQQNRQNQQQKKQKSPFDDVGFNEADPFESNDDVTDIDDSDLPF